MEAIAVIGIDLKKAVFWVHDTDGQGQIALLQTLSRMC